ncbi:MAG TPA: maltose alpha-D-glucosyltransferase [Chloroflexota bacterium]
MGQHGMLDHDAERQPLWYKDAILYELHVRAFYDSNGDGIGDLRGLTEKLDYLQDLGVTAIWLLPFYPSPLRDDGYDIADYTNIHPAYGTIRDFKVFLREAHRRGLRVVTELVLNHTSDQHPWFQRARKAPPGSSLRNFYVWSDTPERYREARIIFKDFEHSNWTWDPVARAYYWHRFYSHQPDLNYENPDVQRAIVQVVDFWLGMGVDGMRLDAVPYLFECEGTNCENLPETHAFLKALRRHVDERYPDRMLLAEANQWPEDAVAYFGDGDECHMAFHFPLMPRMFMAIRMEDRFPIIDILNQTPPIPDSAQWALFLRNHDELTLEMVTDEERDYMYRVYAHDPEARINLGIRRRLAPLLGNHRRRIELMNGLLFSLPGTPVLYYGDEIGMGDNIYLGDRNGVRTPMQWSGDRNAGFSRANPQRLYLPVIVDPEYHYETVHVEAQQNNPHSLLWWMKRLIALRKRFKAFGRGSLEFLYPDNRKILAFVRRYQEETVLVVANLSRFVQYAELDLSAFKGMVPVEAFGRTPFPPIGDRPYFLTLGPHAFYWFSLEPQRAGELRDGAVSQQRDLPTIVVSGSWTEVFQGTGRAKLEDTLPRYLQQRRWFGGKARHIKSIDVLDAVPLPTNGGASTLGGEGSSVHLVLLRVGYTEGDPETYALPLGFAHGSKARAIEQRAPQAAVALLRSHERDGSREGIVYDAVWDQRFADLLLDAIGRRRRFRGTVGEIVASATSAFRHLRGSPEEELAASVAPWEQSNTSIVYGNRLILKLFRRVDEGVNPDLELGRFLTERTAFAHVPQVAGALEYRPARGEPMTLAILQGYVPNEGDAWRYTLDALGNYFELAATRPHGDEEVEVPRRPLVDLCQEELPSLAKEAIGAYLESAQLLGRRTAELHVALASDATDPSFAPVPFSTLQQRSLYQSMRSQASQVFQLLRNRLHTLPDAAREDALRVLDLEEQVLGRFRSLLDQRITAMSIRCHGDYHLGQVLYTGKDFVVIDFEGEPARSLSERRIKRSPLRDVAGMLRSFHYAASVALMGPTSGGVVRPEDQSALEPWARFWYVWVSAAYLRAYLDVARDATFLPHAREELIVLLDAYLLEKAIYELGYELNNRPSWARIPLQGILQLMETAS